MAALVFYFHIITASISVVCDAKQYQLFVFCKPDHDFLFFYFFCSCWELWSIKTIHFGAIDFLHLQDVSRNRLSDDHVVGLPSSESIKG